MIVVLDACVLYPTVLRTILAGVAKAGLIAPVWSDRLLEEWRRAALKNGGPADAALAQAEIAALTRDFPDARIPPPPPGAEAALWLPDPADIHVLATAIAARADTIATLNLRDFPRRELSHHGVAALHPDTLLMDLWLHDAAPVERAVADVLAQANARATEPVTLRPLMKRARLPRLGKALSA